MKKCFSLALCFVMLLVCLIPVQAAGSGEVIDTSELTLENGLVARDTVTVYSQSRSSTITVERERTFYSGDTVVAIITIQATFSYNGSTVSVVSKSVTRTDTYEGWSYKQNSFTSSGGTVTLDAKLTKWLILNTPFTMTLSCDKDGNIT